MLELDLLFIVTKIKVLNQYFIVSTYIYLNATRVLLISTDKSLKFLFLSSLFHCKHS